MHNFEEALTFAAYRVRVQTLASNAFDIEFPVPSTDWFACMLILVTLAAAILLWPLRSLLPLNHQHWPEKALATILLVNIALPHVPLAYFMGGYAPGVVSAVMINMPVSLFVLRARPATCERR